jgi:nitroimidazol reductase NimA-like FMN-containing flavoprotein (pyridoxamine 5'-phosphate oxidase superfamily)
MSANPEDPRARDSPFQELDMDACWAFLSSQQVGRLAVSVGGVPDIFPVNFVVHDRTVVIHTAAGTKLLEIVANRSVAFEVDWWDQSEATSVVIRGRAAALQDESEIAEARALRLQSWVPTAKSVYVQIRPMAVSGRRIRLTADVEEGRTGRQRNIADLAWTIAGSWRPPSPAPPRPNGEDEVRGGLP